MDAKQAIVCEIQQLHSRREPLNIAAVRRNHPTLLRNVFAIRPFWGWIQALRDAGLHYQDINVEWDEFVECRICQGSYRRLAKHLKVHDITAEEYRNEYHAEVASEYEQAKLQRRGRETKLNQGQLPLWDVPFCEEVTLDRIAEYHRRGDPVHYFHIDRLERSLINHAIFYFGSWDNALQRIGLDPFLVRHHSVAGSIQYPTADSVLGAIRERYNHQRRLNQTAAIEAPPGAACQHHITLWRWACFFFGGWDEAVRAAGLPAQRLMPAPRAWSAELVLKEIQQRHSAGMGLATVDLISAPQNRDRALYQNAQRLFGSWGRAIAQAGLPPQGRRTSHGRYGKGRDR